MPRVRVSSSLMSSPVWAWFEMTAIYQTYHLILQLFMTLILLRECLFVSNKFVAWGKQIYTQLKDLSPPKQMFHVNLFSSNMWVWRGELFILCPSRAFASTVCKLARAHRAHRSLILLFGKCGPDAGSLWAPMFHGCQSQRWSFLSSQWSF